jgi:transposase
MALTIVDTSRPVTGGVDTHLDLNVAAALDGIGGLLGVEQFATTTAGNKALLVWLKGLGTVVKVGVEGTGSYGAPLARYLRRAGVAVIEVDRPRYQVLRGELDRCLDCNRLLVRAGLPGQIVRI